MRDYTKLTDDELIVRSSHLDERAFEALYKRYEKRVYSLIYFKLKNPDDAADATQETFVKLWQKASLFSKKGSVGAFICTIANNTATDFLRKRDETLSLTVVDDNGDESELTITDVDRTPEEEVLHGEEIVAVRHAVESLQEQHRDVIVLCVINKMSYIDAANTLGIDVGTVKSRLSRARAALREKMKDFYGIGNKPADYSVNKSDTKRGEVRKNER